MVSISDHFYVSGAEVNNTSEVYDKLHQQNSVLKCIYLDGLKLSGVVNSTTKKIKRSDILRWRISNIMFCSVTWENIVFDDEV